MIQKGKFIVFEGIDCSGKSTAITLLESYLNTKQINYITIKFPDRHGLHGEQIDRYLKKELILSDSEAYELFKENRKAYKEYINNYLNDGVYIICDRYIYSGIVYSYYNIEKNKLTSTSNININYVNQLLTNENYMPVPDLIYLIHGYRPRQNEISEKYEKIEINNIIFNLFNNLFSKLDVKYNIINNNETIKFTTNQIISNFNELK